MLLMIANREFTGPAPEEGDETASTDRPGRPAIRNVRDKTGPEWAAAYRWMMERLEKGASLGGLKIDRKDLYDR